MKALGPHQPYNKPDEVGKDLESEVPRHGLPIDANRVLQMLWLGKVWLLIGALLGCAGGVIAAKVLVGRTYQASALLVFEGLPQIEGLPSRGPHEFNTLVGAIRTPSNLNEVLRRCDTRMPTNVFFKTIQVDATPGSSRVVVSTKADTAPKAAKLTDTLLDVFIEHRLKVESERIEKLLNIVEEDLENAQKSLKEARTRYDAFRQEHGIADFTAEQHQAIAAAAELQTKANMARAEAEAEAVRAKQLRAAQRQQRATTVISESQSTPEHAELAQARTKLAQARARLAPDHPQVQALEGQVDALRNRARQSKSFTSQRTVGVNPTYAAVSEGAAGAAANRDAARASEETLNALFKTARERVEQLSEVEGEASKLLSDVQTSEKRVSALSSQRAKVRDAARSPIAGFRIEERAQIPEHPLRSRRKLVVAAGVPTATVLLVVGLLLGRELWGLRVKTATEVGYWGKGTVIGSTTWPRDPEALDDFLGELDDYLPDLRGSTLVVGATPNSVETAGEMARGIMKAVFLTHQYFAMEQASGRSVDLLEAPRRNEGGNSIDPDSTGEVIDVDATIDGERVRGVIVDDEANDRDTLPSKVETSAIEPYEEPVPHVDVSAMPKVGYWNGPETGPAIRRAARLADRVLIVVPAGETSIFDLLNTRPRLGREHGIGFVVVYLEDIYTNLPDRAGNQEEFWYYFKA